MIKLLTDVRVHALLALLRVALAAFCLALLLALLALRLGALGRLGRLIPWLIERDLAPDIRRGLPAAYGAALAIGVAPRIFFTISLGAAREEAVVMDVVNKAMPLVQTCASRWWLSAAAALIRAQRSQAPNVVGGVQALALVIL